MYIYIYTYTYIYIYIYVYIYIYIYIYIHIYISYIPEYTHACFCICPLCACCPHPSEVPSGDREGVEWHAARERPRARPFPTFDVEQATHNAPPKVVRLLFAMHEGKKMVSSTYIDPLVKTFNF